MGGRVSPLVVAALIVLGPAQAAGTQELVIRKSGVEKAKIAVPDMTEDGRTVRSELATELSTALRFDLDNCGYYRVVGGAAEVADAQRRDVESANVLLPNWRSLGAELVFKADFTRAGDRLAISCFAYETSRGKLAFKRTLKGPRDDGRRLVHHLSNEILRVLVGIDVIATTRIAFIKDNPDKGKDLYLVDYDGHNLRRVTSDRGVAVSPDWSPDAQSIYYTSLHKGEPHVYRIDLRKNQRVPVARFPGLNYATAVSPDGRTLALVLSKSGTPDIYTMNIKGGKPVRLTRSIGKLSTCPVWSYDARRIAYVSDIEGGPQLYVMNADGTGQRRLLRGYREMSSLDWSPKAATGHLLAFSARVHGRRQLFAVDMKTDVVRQLTFDPAEHEDPNFAPDGRHIVYVCEPRSGAADLYILDVFDPKPVRITSFEGNEFYPAWSPAGY